MPPLPWGVYQTRPSGAGATSCGREPGGVANDWSSGVARGVRAVAAVGENAGLGVAGGRAGVAGRGVDGGGEGVPPGGWPAGGDVAAGDWPPPPHRATASPAMAPPPIRNTARRSIAESYSRPVTGR
jgi:hypothetical protein